MCVPVSVSETRHDSTIGNRNIAPQRRCAEIENLDVPAVAVHALVRNPTYSAAGTECTKAGGGSIAGFEPSGFQDQTVARCRVPTTKDIGAQEGLNDFGSSWAE